MAKDHPDVPALLQANYRTARGHAWAQLVIGAILIKLGAYVGAIWVVTGAVALVRLYTAPRGTIEHGQVETTSPLVITSTNTKATPTRHAVGAFERPAAADVGDGASFLGDWWFATTDPTVLRLRVQGVVGTSLLWPVYGAWAVGVLALVVTWR